MINGWHVTFEFSEDDTAFFPALGWTRLPCPWYATNNTVVFKLFYGLRRYSNELHANEGVMLVSTMMINHSSVAPCTAECWGH